jgi:hypothetical protein
VVAENEPDEVAELLPGNLRERLRQRQRMINRQEASAAQLLRNQKQIREAIGILEELIAAQGRDPRYVLERAKSHARLSELQYHSDDLEASRDSRRTAIDDLEALVREHPAEPEYAAVLAQVLALPGDANDAARIASLERAAALCNELLDPASRNLDLVQLDAEINSQLGELLAQQQSADAAVAAWTRSLDMLRQLATDGPANRDVMIRGIAVTLDLAQLLLEAERYREARDLLRAATTRMQRQFRGMRGAQPPRLVLARYYTLLADAQTGLGDERGAAQSHRQARQLESRGDGR